MKVEVVDEVEPDDLLVCRQLEKNELQCISFQHFAAAVRSQRSDM